MLRNLITPATSILLVLVCSVKSQEDSGSQQPKDTKILLPPTEIQIPRFPFGHTLTPDSAIIVWKGPPNADTYTIALLKSDDKSLILHEEIQNVHGTRYEFERLESSTQYQVIMRSVRVNTDGTTDESGPSKAFFFSTLSACKGGMIHVGCSAHCTPTCEKPRPLCDRRCVSGCTCPKDIPFLKNGRCISKLDCDGAEVTETLNRPTGLKIHRVKGTNELLFTWDEVKEADFYTVNVKLRDGTIVQRVDRVKIPFLVIKGLKPRTPYKFQVQAKFVKFDGSRSQPFGVPKPNAPTVTKITDGSFVVQWEDYQDAESYNIAITNSDTDELLQIFKSVKGNSVSIQGLESGTSYDVTIIAVTSKYSIESSATTAQTLGIGGGYDSNQAEISYEMEEMTTTTTAPTTTPSSLTCLDRQQALDLLLEGDEEFDAHIPDCDPDGNFRPTQCEKDVGCYCVEPKSGVKHPGSDFDSLAARYYIDCNRYGQLKVNPLKVFSRAVDTTSIKVRWNMDPDVAFYIVKIYDAEKEFVTYVTGITKSSVVIGGLARGTPYTAIVVGVNRQGWSSSDGAPGGNVITPYLNPPTDLKIEQLSQNRMKASWTKNSFALHYQVKIFESGKDEPRTYDNVTDDHVIFSVQGNGPITVSVKSTGVTTLSESGKTISVSSNAAEASITPSCSLQPMDVIFVFDTSASMSSQEHGKSKELFSLLSESFSPLVKSIKEPTGVRVAGVKASSTSRQMFRFNRYDSQKNLIDAIKSLSQARTTLNLRNMLLSVYRSFFWSYNKDDQRDVVTAVVAFVGGSTTPTDFALEAAQLRSVTNVITVGVIGRTNTLDMSYMSESANRVLIDSFDDVRSGYEKVMEILCKLEKRK